MHWFSKVTIRNQLIFLASITFVLLILIFSVFYTQNKEIIKQKNTEYTVNMISQLQQDVASYRNSIDKLLMNIAYNPDMQEFMLETDYGNRYELSKKISSVLNNARLMKEGIVDVIVVGNSGSFYSTFGGNEYVTKYQQLFSSSPFISGLKEVNFGSNIKGTKFFIAGLSTFATYDAAHTGTQIGYCYLVIDAKEITALSFPKIGKEEMKFYLLDRDHQVFTSNDTAAIGGNSDFLTAAEALNGQSAILTLNGVRQIVQTEKLPEIGGTIISAIPEKALYSEIRKLRLNVIYLLLTAIFILSVPFILIMNNLIKPIRQITNFILGIRTKQTVIFKQEIKLEGYFEMTILSSKLNTMFNEIDSLTRNLIDANIQLYRVELEKKKAELAFLQSQINPHFLYNTFETIKGIAMIRGVHEIKDMVQDLSRIFRYSIKGTEEVSLQEELDTISAYLRIQKTRFKDRFDIQMDINPRVLTCKVPKMILQPIVENAIIHGLEPLSKKGHLRIMAEIDPHNKLVISVKDNGNGMPEEMSEALLKNAEGKDPFEQHLGLKNVNNRIQFICGDEYGLSFQSQENLGTEVIFHLPLKENEDV
ncbi:sensor histidine kinase [Paenibacillus qinlingensis]|uniref:Two-component system sensor histidine kinase YesM n=1 Tax=Paenibacillus qinlingensis TaxID=1837343 RepID=A0ABU1NZM0_9BACL|nr:sensor histidine kinase [Paenibacillus qinlingensis]MDR6552910.1 two-component system sensor histidine kinase YesM [Paenibacillus qinlingensis]